MPTRQVASKTVKRSVVFVKYFDHCQGTAKTEFLAIESVCDPQEVTADAVTKKLLEVIGKCELFVENLKAFVSDGANVMVGEGNGVAARLKRLNQSIVNFHCICHKRALVCGDSGDQKNYIKDGWTDGRMDGWTDGRMDRWTDGRMDGWTDGRMDGWTDGWMDGWMDEWMDGWMDGWIVY